MANLSSDAQRTTEPRVRLLGWQWWQVSWQLTGVIWFVIKNNTPTANSGINRTEVTLSSENLEKLGVSRNSVSDQGTILTVGPAATFNNKVRLEK